MRFLYLRLMPGLAFCCLLCGCDRPDAPDAKLPEVDQAAQLKVGEEFVKKQQEQSANKIQTAELLTVLRVLGPVAEWQVSTDKQGKADDALVKAKQNGTFDAVMKKAFTNRGLLLKFFTSLPYAINGLRTVEPRPETCDFICEIPPKWQPDIEALLGKPDAKTSDTDEAGKPRDWYRFSEVSFGVVDGSIKTVRVDVDSKARTWELLQLN